LRAAEIFLSSIDQIDLDGEDEAIVGFALEIFP